MTEKITSIPYEDIVQNALRTVVHDVLIQVAKNGLPGNHHLYITFQTGYPGVQMADYLKDRHPDDVTIVLQYQFWDLEVSDKGFSITLSFSDVKEKLYIPYAAITGFVDPSVKFGLQFTPLEIEEDMEEDISPTDHKTSSKKQKKSKESLEETSEQETTSAQGKVITLDEFRKKK